MSRIIDILTAIRNGETYTGEPLSRVETILICFFKNLTSVASFTDTTTNGFYKDRPLNYKVKAGVTYTLTFTITGATEPFNTTIGFGDKAYLSEGCAMYILKNGKVSITFTPTSEQLANGNDLYFRPARYSGNTVSTYTVSDIVLKQEYTQAAQSRHEQLLLAIKNGQKVSGTARTRVEKILFAIANGEALPTTYVSDLEQAYILAANKLKGA